MSTGTYDGEWLLDGGFGHEFWVDVKVNHPRMYWPKDTDAFIELYLDPVFGDPVRLRRTAGVQNTDGDYVTFSEGVGGDPDEWFDKSGIGYASFDWTWKYANAGRGSMGGQNIDRIRFWGHVYSTIGTRFWFEAEEATEGGPIYLDRMRIPVPREMVDEVIEWAAERGCEHLHTKGAVFERRFSTDEGIAQPHHMDVHVRCRNIQTGQELLDILNDGIDFVERAARRES